MKWLIGVLALMWLFLPLNVRVAFPASVTLNSGEVMEGTITSETDAEIRLETANESHTIVSTRVISKSDIKSVTRDAPEQKAQQTAYFALDKYELYPSQELTAAQYKQGIDAFEKFLSDYPKSSHAEEVRGKLGKWKVEAANLQSGKAKFAGKWMIPEDKNLRSLQQKLADLQQQRNSVNTDIANWEANLASLQPRLQSLPSQVEVPTHVWETVYTGSDHHGNPIYRTVDRSTTRTITNPEIAHVNALIASAREAIAKGEASLPALDVRIQTIQTELPEAQNAYKVALANSNAASPPVVRDQPTNPPLSPKP